MIVPDLCELLKASERKGERRSRGRLTLQRICDRPQDVFPFFRLMADEWVANQA